MNDPLKRVTIQLPKTVLEKGVKAAENDRRNFSKHVQVLIERDLGLIPNPKPLALKQAA